MSYTLEPYRTPSSRHTCPSCGAKRQFTRYINTDSGEYLADHVGRCNREQSCTYHYTPKQYFQDHPIIQSTNYLAESPFSSRRRAGDEVLQPNPKPPSFIPPSIFQSSLSNYKHNNFITFLSSIFDPPTVTHLINTYFIGTSKNWSGSTVFWQIDYQGNIRDGKIMLYDPANGRRVKQPYNHITWAHSALKLKEYNLQQCFFGEHLLKLHPQLPVSIVESEKTAIIASVYFPQFIWLATGGKHGCKWSSHHVATVLIGRHINLWPDIKAYDEWKIKAVELAKSGLLVLVSNLLEKVSTEFEKEAGLDIADYLIKYKPDQFINAPIMVKTSIDKPSEIPQALHSILPPISNKVITKSTFDFHCDSQNLLSFSDDEPDQAWDIDSLESFFNSAQLPQTPIRLDQCTVIYNLPKFISGHLAVLRTYNGNRVFLPYFQRLQMLQQLIKF